MSSLCLLLFAVSTLNLVQHATVASVQPATASVHGRVTDPSGAVVIGATVVVTDAPGGARTTKTDRQGAYAVDRLPPGAYVVVVTAAGFAEARELLTIDAASIDASSINAAAMNAAAMNAVLDRVLDFTLAIDVQRQTIVVEGSAVQIPTDPSANANAFVLKGRDLDALSDDPNELELQLKALAGGAAGPAGGQIYIDGFTGGRLPSKSSIAEIRVNQNPYSAEYDTPGSARVEVITKPGGQTFHGRFLADINRAFMNSRNPFLTEDPAYQSGAMMGSVEGPLGPRASFSFGVDRVDIHDASAIAAIGLDSALNPVAIHEAFPSRHDTLQVNPRVDAQLPRTHTVSARYLFYGVTDAGSGVGQFALPSQAIDARRTEHDVQLSDRHVVSARTFNETHIELRRSSIDQTPRDTTAQIAVLGAFTGGGSAAGSVHSVVDHVEFQDVVTASRGNHLVKLGGRVRVDAASDLTAQNVNGTFTFASLDAYQITEQGLAEGWRPDAIRAAGGGASQFSIVYGQPSVHQTMADLGAFVEDEWRVANRLTAGLGLRYEVQDGIARNGDLAPRGSLAVAIGRSPKNGAPATVLRVGGGIFYDRVPQNLFLQSMRLDGTRTRQFIVSSPDFYPLIPSAAVLSASEIASTPYLIDPAIAPPRMLQAGATLERKLAPGATAAVGFLHCTGSRELYSRVFDGTYEFTSGGRFAQDQLTVNVTIRNGSRVSLGAAYVLSSAHGDTSGPNSFPSNPQNLEADYGRTPFDVRHHLTMFMGIDGPGFRVVPSIFASSGQPFDITVGRDLNGDSIFNDRPAFATDLSRPSVVSTPFGTFDTAPIAGQQIIPRNYGNGPPQVLVTLRAMKPFVVHQHDTIRIDLLAVNLLNRANLALPVGNLSSPVFGRSTALASGGANSSNRQIRVQLQFIF